ncbi:hypothetical protein VN1340_12910 [Helicobacter pylori]
MKLNQRSEKQNEILSVLYEVHRMYEKAIEQDASRFKRYQSELHSVKLDLMQKGFDDFNDATFNKIHSLKKEFSEQERSKEEGLERLNGVIDLFKESIDKVFDRVSAFTWEKYKEENDDEEDDEANYREFEEIKKKEFSDQERSKREGLARLNGVIGLFKESIDKVFDRVSAFTWKKYKEQNDDEEDEEANYREFEEIKEMVLYFRNLVLFYLDCLELSEEGSEEEIQEAREELDNCNKLLQLHYSLENLQTLREFKEKENEGYQECLNDEELQNDLREWRRTKNQQNNNKAFNTNDTNLFETIQAVIAEQLEIDASQVTPEAKFVKDLGVDSLDIVELIMALEERFGIEIPDEQAEKIVNVGDVMRYIEKQLI